MTSVVTLHVLGILTSYIVLGTGCGVLFLSDKWLGPCRALRLKAVAVILSTVGATWWIVATAVLQDAASCKSDTLYCLTGGVYHLLRNLAFLLFHVAVLHDVRIVARRRETRRANKAKRRAAKLPRLARARGDDGR